MTRQEIKKTFRLYCYPRDCENCKYKGNETEGECGIDFVIDMAMEAKRSRE